MKYFIFIRSIHNQSYFNKIEYLNQLTYINLEKKYNTLLKQNILYKKEIDNLNNNILKLTQYNNKLLQENKLISEDLNQKNKFYNLHSFKIFYLTK